MRRIILLTIILFFSCALAAEAADSGAPPAAQGQSGERLARPKSKNAAGLGRDEQVFRAIYPTAPKSLDPHVGPDPAAWPIIMAAYNRLMTFEAGTAKPTYALVKAMAVSPDGLKYTFQLHEGHSFSDGSVLNTEAVYYSFDRLMASEVGRLYYPYLQSFEPTGPYSFILTLKRPWPPFLASLALPQASIISPGLKNKAEGYLNDKTLGSGPYMVYDWRDNTIGLSVRPDQVSRPPLAFAMFHYEPDAQKRYEKMTAHDAHLTVDPALPAEGPPAQYRLLKVPGFGVRFLAFNTRQPYTRLQNTRRALGAVIKTAFKEHPRVVPGLFPAGLFYNAPASLNRPVVGDADPLAQATLILKDVGLPAGPLTLAVQGQGVELDRDAGQIAEALAAHGFKVNIVNIIGPEGRKILDGGAYDLYLGSREPDIPAADMWLGRFLSSQSSPEGNPAFFHSGRADQMILGIMDTVGQPGDGPHDYYLRGIALERARKLADLAALAETEAPYVFLYQLERPLVVDLRLYPKDAHAPLPHPMWPEVWPLDATRIRPFSFRSGANPTGRKPDEVQAPPPAGAPAVPAPAAADPATTPETPAPVPPQVQAAPAPARPEARSEEQAPAAPNPKPALEDFIGVEMTD